MGVDPFLIEGPAVISVSGGRTSGYMLWRILQAHGGKLPDNVRAMFANTGKEMPETLDFVQEMSEQWSVPITWVEYESRQVPSARWRVVDHATASRNGEPFEAVIRSRSFLPNPVSRFCTVELKVRAMHRYLFAQGWKEWTSAVGIRADEPRRVAKIGNQDYGKHEERVAPLAQAGIVVADVGAFWREQPFDLRLPNMNGKTMHGNCDLCYLKGANQILSLIREQPERAKWWMKMEALALALASKPSGAVFRSDRPSYAVMHRMATTQDEMFEYGGEPLQDCMCVD